ncbi:hypothetical protein DAI22_09g002900 [Oryza sativa Japonica Group]|nr:hypothetical protein DAI22_09g002900 [Oryza sativa Japonica Group]
MAVPAAAAKMAPPSKVQVKEEPVDSDMRTGFFLKKHRSTPFYFHYHQIDHLQTQLPYMLIIKLIKLMFQPTWWIDHMKLCSAQLS